MNIITSALHTADAAVSLAKVSTTRADDIKMYDEALTVIRKARAEQDHIADAGKMVAEPLQILPGGGAFPFVEVGYVGEFVAPTESLPAGTPLCVGPVQPVKQEPVCKRCAGWGVVPTEDGCSVDKCPDCEWQHPVQHVKQEPVAWIELALEALVYHTQQTRPIQKTDETIIYLQSLLNKQGQNMFFTLEDAIKKFPQIDYWYREFEKHNITTAPVSAKAIRAEALEEAEEIAKTIGGSFSVEFLAAIRELK